MYNQGLGSTADSEFEMENSMYPLENGYVFQKYYGNTWYDIYSTLKNAGYYTSFMHPNTSTFWNREAVYNEGYNIDEYDDITMFPDIERAGEFYSDEGIHLNYYTEFDDSGNRVIDVAFRDSSAIKSIIKYKDGKFAKASLYDKDGITLVKNFDNEEEYLRFSLDFE